jgi:hypothetical protein
MFSKRMWPYGSNTHSHTHTHTHTHTSKVSSERSLRFFSNLSHPFPTLADVLITPLQRHSLLGGVIDLGRLPDSLGPLSPAVS